MKYLHSTLIIEDNPGDTYLLKLQLEKAGWPVDNCHCEARLTDAVESLKKFKPVIIFLDLNLPDSNELETFLTIQSAAPDIPVIILSGINDSALSLQAVQAGAQDFLTKGEFDERLLLKTILYGIERKKTQLRLEEVNKRFTYASKATNDPLWDLDMKTGDILWNDKIAIFGYSASIPKNRLWKSSNIHSEDQERFTKKWNEFLTQDKEQWEKQYRFRCADGTYKHIYERGYLLKDSENKPYRMIGTMQDITETVERRQKQEMEKQKKETAILKKAIENQENERSEISWELLENINQILVSANLKLEQTVFLSNVNVPAAIKESQNLILAAVDGIKKITHNIESSSIRFAGLIPAIENFIAQITLPHDCTIKFNHQINEEAVSNSTSLTIFRIIQDQLVNTIKHTEATNIYINLTEKEGMLTVDITDDGKGFDKNEIKKNVHLTNIFNRTRSYNGKVIFRKSQHKGFKVSVQIPEDHGADET